MIVHRGYVILYSIARVGLIEKANSNMLAVQQYTARIQCIKESEVSGGNK